VYLYINHEDDERIRTNSKQGINRLAKENVTQAIPA
jgi:hypothetical protein